MLRDAHDVVRRSMGTPREELALAYLRVIVEKVKAGQKP